MTCFSLLRPPDDDRYCQILKMAGEIKNMTLPSRGKSMQGRYDESRDFRMADTVKGMQVPDVIANAFNFLMVTGELKAVLEAHAAGVQIEYLPFRLLNHKGRAAAENCFIVNVLGTLDCADKSKSRGVETAIYPGEYLIARQVTLVVSSIPPEINIFRTSLFPPGVWVRDDLRAAIEKHNLKVRYVASGEDL